MFLEVKMLKDWVPLLKLQAKLKKNEKHLFRSKQTKKKVPPKIFTGLKVRKKIKLMFSKPKDCMKGKRYVFRDSKKRIKMPLMFLDVKVIAES